jgi:integration host factor subunit beta
LLKTDIVRAIAKKGGISYLDADDFVNIMFEAIIQALLHEERTAIRGFGNFTVRHYGERKSHNPKTGAEIMAAPVRVPYFRAGKELLNRVNNRENTC